MKKENSITIEGVTIDLNTKPEELMATGKFREYDGSFEKILSTNEWIEAFGTEFLGDFYFAPDHINIKLYPKLDIESPGYPDPDYEKASWEVCKTIIYNHFDNVVYKDNKVSSIFYDGKISTTLIGESGRNPCSGGFISIAIRGEDNV